VSLDEPEPVDSVLMFLSGYDTLEYSWVKATAVSVRLWILFMTLQSTNSAAVSSSSHRTLECVCVLAPNRGQQAQRTWPRGAGEVESGWIGRVPRVGSGWESGLGLEEGSRPFEPKGQYEIGKYAL
jgi:hypothetical protein